MEEENELNSQRFSIMTQLAIETVYNSDDIQNRLLGEPAFGQLVYDALYYPSRFWEKGQHCFSVAKDDFEMDLLSRLETAQFEVKEARLSAEAHPNRGGEAIADSDATFLFEKMGLVVQFLARPADLAAALERARPPHAPPDAAKTMGRRMIEIPLLLDIGNNQYRWLFDESGRDLSKRIAPGSEAMRTSEASTDVADACARIIDLRLLLLDFSESMVDYDRIVDIFRPIQICDLLWPDALTSIRRFRKEMIAGGAYPEQSSDETLIRTFFDWLNGISKELCYCLFCAWMLKSKDGSLDSGLTAVQEKLPDTREAAQETLDQLVASVLSKVQDEVIADRYAAFLQAGLGIDRWTHAMRRLFSGSDSSTGA
jgi:hypothetical protein